MSRQCARCGQALPRNNARFCNLCGEAVPADQSALGAKDGNALRSAPLKPLRDEGMASAGDASGSRPTPPARRPQGDQGIPRTGSRPALREQIAYQPPARPSRPPSRDEPPAWMNQLEKGTFPSPGMTYPVRPASNPPARELHVKVWEPQPPVPSQGELEQIETRPLVSQPQARSVSSPPVRGVQEGARTADAGGSRRGSNRAPTGREMASHTGAGGSRPAPTGLYSQPAVDVKQAPPASVSVRRVTQARKKSRGPLIFISVLFLLVVVAGLTAWVIVFSPFSVPGVTSVDLPFQDTTLGIALRYPQGWTARADSKHEAAYFYDSSHTGQVTILTAPANGSGAEQYIRKVAAQQGMTGQSSQPALSFAGAVWEQLKGSVILSGATYSETLLVTEHAHRFYTIEQLAPSSVYNDEERLVFARLRSSFSFLS